VLASLSRKLAPSLVVGFDVWGEVGVLGKVERGAVLQEA